jgi:NAD+ diphosphatase
MPSLPANPNVFANFPLDKHGHRRKDAQWLEGALAAPEARITPFHKCQPFLLEGGREIAWLGPHALGAIADADATMLFLGVDDAGAAHFALDMRRDPAETPLAELGEFTEMRAAAAQLPGADCAILGCAKSLFEWHARHGFCANCGAKSIVAEGGWKRECPACGAEHFPRVDPVVIMAATCNGKVLLGRQKRWPAGMYSALAGFLEPGESIEEGCARELFEEAGVVATNVRYHSTQPWPFPSSLMIGLIADVASEAVNVDGEELDEARWFTRDEAQALIERRHADAFAPGALAIAHQLIKAWAFA